MSLKTRENFSTGCWRETQNGRGIWCEGGSPLVALSLRMPQPEDLVTESSPWSAESRDFRDITEYNSVNNWNEHESGFFDRILRPWFQPNENLGRESSQACLYIWPAVLWDNKCHCFKHISYGNFSWINRQCIFSQVFQC